MTLVFDRSNESITKVVGRFKAHFEIRVKPEAEKFLRFSFVGKEDGVNLYSQLVRRRLLEFC